MANEQQHPRTVNTGRWVRRRDCGARRGICVREYGKIPGAVGCWELHSELLRVCYMLGLGHGEDGAGGEEWRSEEEDGVARSRGDWCKRGSFVDVLVIEGIDRMVSPV